MNLESITKSKSQGGSFQRDNVSTKNEIRGRGNSSNLDESDDEDEDVDIFQ